MHFFDYLPIEDWKIVDKRTFHFYDENETSLEAICVEIGVMNSFNSTISGTSLVKTPIIRWISEAQYNNLKKNSGVVIFG